MAIELPRFDVETNWKNSSLGLEGLASECKLLHTSLGIGVNRFSIEQPPRQIGVQITLNLNDLGQNEGTPEGCNGSSIAACREPRNRK